MSDQQLGEDWWLASDGKWYPPQPPVAPPAVARPATTTNGYAVASLVLSICGIVFLLPLIGSILGIVFGHLSLSQLNESEQQGRGMAIAGLVLGYLGVAATAVMIIAVIVLVASFS